MSTPLPTSERWGELRGRPVARFTLTNERGTRLRVSELGATLTELWLADRHGVRADVLLGYDTLAQYLADRSYLGCVVGRCANRIAGARFTLDGREHVLGRNDGGQHLHGGPRGFHRHVWRGAAATVAGGQAVRLELTSPDGDEGYPGRLEASVTYTLGDDDVLAVAFAARADAPTLVNLAQHAYWNLAGHDAGSVAAHVLRLHAESVLPVDAGLIPRGPPEPVAGTSWDFRAARALGDAGGRLGPGGAGFDQPFVVDGAAGSLRPVAELHDPASGRRLTLESDQPGCQLYTANGFDGSLRGKGGARYARHAGVCLETQAHPDAIHREGEAETVVLRPGASYRHAMRLRFGTR